MRKIGIILVCLIVSPTIFSQAFEKDRNYITLGYGLDPYGGANKYNAGFNHRKAIIGPFILTYERGITDILGIGRIGVGGAVAQTFYTSTSYTANNLYEYRSTRSRTTLAFRAAYHFDFGVEKMDVYAGVGGALHIISDSYTTNNPNDPTYGYKRGSVSGGPSVFGGIRYFFSNSFGVYAEAGYDISALNGGVVFKF